MQARARTDAVRGPTTASGLVEVLGAQREIRDDGVLVYGAREHILHIQQPWDSKVLLQQVEACLEILRLIGL